jgi:hypothetical protein
MRLDLTPLAADEVIGIYGPKKDQLPERMRFLHPAAAASYREHLSAVIVSDMLRSAESSLLARRERRGGMRPAYSGHNYGFSIDIDVGATMKKLGFKTKPELDAFMQVAGWYCHRRDGKTGHEAWHYNHGIAEFIQPKDTHTSTALERKIIAFYGKSFALSPVEIQTALAELKLYRGAIDGKIGPLSKEAIQAFQRAWLIAETGKIDTLTTRTLAFVSAER